MFSGPSRMVRRHNPLKARPKHMGVNLRGPDVGMSQHRLHAPQISPTLEKMSCEGVAQDVGAEVTKNPRGFASHVEQLPEGLTGHPCAAGRNEKIWTAPALQQRWSSL